MGVGTILMHILGKERAILNTFKGFKRKHREQNSSRLAEKKPSTCKNRKHSFWHLFLLCMTIQWTLQPGLLPISIKGFREKD